MNAARNNVALRLYEDGWLRSCERRAPADKTQRQGCECALHGLAMKYPTLTELMAYRKRYQAGEGRQELKQIADQCWKLATGASQR